VSGLPDAFVARLLELFGPRADEVLATHARKPPPAFRVNRLRAEPAAVLEELAAAGIDAVPLLDTEHAYEVPREQRERLTHSAAVSEGRAYVHNPASLLPVLLLAPQPGESVLDLCAAPGGKTLHIAERMRLEGELSAVEKVKPRFFRLKANLERHGAGRFVRAFLMDGRLVEKKTPDRFDRVLVDAPCSSEARFSLEEPETFARWSERKVEEMASKQRKLLLAATRAVKPGGVVVYSTCSYAPEENEAVLAHVLKKNPEVALEELELPFGEALPGLTAFGRGRFSDEVARARRVFPSGSLHGFFVAKLRRLS
jgi:NOL1/NOP2/sun family putative RNA methylase